MTEQGLRKNVTLLNNLSVCPTLPQNLAKAQVTEHKKSDTDYIRVRLVSDFTDNPDTSDNEDKSDNSDRQIRIGEEGEREREEIQI